MRKLIFGLAIAVAALAMPAVASADIRAVLGAQYSNVDNGAGDNSNVYGLNGAFNNDFSNGWTVQADAANLRNDNGGGVNLGAGYGAVEIGVRNDQYAIYGSFGLADASGVPSTTAFGIGGQYYLNNITLDGSFTYADVDGLNSNPTQIAVDGTYFFNDNLGVTARYAHTDLDAGSNSDFNTWGIGAEYRFDNSPVSVNVAYSSTDTNPDNTQVWSIGVKLDFGSSSLHDRSQHGPSWNSASTFFGDVSGL